MINCIKKNEKTKIISTALHDLSAYTRALL